MSNALIRSCMSNPLFSIREFDRTFSELFQRQGWVDNGFPRVEQRATEEELVIQMALSAYPKNAIHVEVQGDTLTIKGDKVEDERNLFASRAFTWSRRDVYGQWVLDKADVTYQDGALTIVVPKKKEKEPKLLEIK